MDEGPAEGLRGADGFMLSRGTSLRADVKRVEGHVAAECWNSDWYFSDRRLRTHWQQQPVVLQTSYAEVSVRVECDVRKLSCCMLEPLKVSCGALAWQPWAVTRE